MPNEPQPAPQPDAGADLPTVSAVIPAYNAAETIERALRSVYAQIYPNIIEVIVVDDGSTDATAQIVREQFPDVTLIRQENAGSPTARNRGVEAASGEYIAFLDDDDEWFPEKTEVQMMCFRECPGLRMTIADSIQVIQDHAPPPRVGTDSEVLLTPIVFSNVFPRVPFHYGCSGWVLHRALFAECGGFAPHMRRSQDTEWLWRVLFRGYSAGRLRRPLYAYYPSHSRRALADRARMWRIWYEVLPPVVQDYAAAASRFPSLLSVSDVRQRLSDFYWSTAWSLWAQGLETEAREHLREARKLAPAGLVSSLRHRLAAWQPGLYQALSRARGADREEG